MENANRSALSRALPQEQNVEMAIFTFDGFELDTGLFELRRDGEPCPMEPQVFTVLAYLVEHHDRVVTKTELIDHVWGDRFISEAALTSRLMAARRALGDSGQEQRYIKTMHRRGYRFVEAVSAGAPGPAPRHSREEPWGARRRGSSPAVSAARTDVRFCHPGWCAHRTQPGEGPA
jgi:DNA-binding winged helix-turn-helix (wHTH) protein